MNVNERFTDANDEDIYNYEFDEEPEEDIKVDISTLIKNNSNENYTPLVLTEREKVMMEIVKYLNTPMVELIKRELIVRLLQKMYLVNP